MNSGIFRRAMCFLGLHQKVWRERWEPSFGAKIVTEYEYKSFCLYCGKTLFHHHVKWDGNEMVRIKK